MPEFWLDTERDDNQNICMPSIHFLDTSEEFVKLYPDWKSQ